VSNIDGWMYTKPVAIGPSEVEFAPRGWFEGLRITGAAIRTPSLASKAIPFHVSRELVANFSCSLPGIPNATLHFVSRLIREILSLLREVVTGRIHGYLPVLGGVVWNWCNSGRPIRYCNIVTLGHRERLDQVGHLPALSVDSSEHRSGSVARSDAQYSRGAGVSERMNHSGRNMHKPARLNSLCHTAANKIHLAFDDVEGFIPRVRMRRWANSFRGIMYVDFVASSLSMVRQDCDFLAKNFAWRDQCTIRNY
jgi:hypothetical protein